MPDDCLECTSMLCEISKHATDIQQLHDDIISACIDASEGIPSTRKSNKNVPVAYLNHTCICKQCNTPPLF